jgi:hypothetical protein
VAPTIEGTSLSIGEDSILNLAPYYPSPVRRAEARFLPGLFLKALCGEDVASNLTWVRFRVLHLPAHDEPTPCTLEASREPRKVSTPNPTGTNVDSPRLTSGCVSFHKLTDVTKTSAVLQTYRRQSSFLDDLNWLHARDQDGRDNTLDFPSEMTVRH